MDIDTLKTYIIYLFNFTESQAITIINSYKNSNTLSELIDFTNEKIKSKSDLNGVEF